VGLTSSAAIERSTATAALRVPEGLVENHAPPFDACQPDQDAATASQLQLHPHVAFAVVRPLCECASLATVCADTERDLQEDRNL
jgi:hypothetical protein